MLQDTLSILLSRVEPEVVAAAERQDMGNSAALYYFPLSKGCDYRFYLGVYDDCDTLELGANLFDITGTLIEAPFWGRLWENWENVEPTNLKAILEVQDLLRKVTSQPSRIVKDFGLFFRGFSLFVAGETGEEKIRGRRFLRPEKVAAIRGLDEYHCNPKS